MKDKKLIAFNMYDTWVHMTSRSNPYKSFFSVLGIEGATAKQISRSLLTSDQDIKELLPRNVLSSFAFAESLIQLEQDIQRQLSSIFVYPDFLPTIDFLKGQGYELAVVSNLSAPYAYPLTHLIGSEIFDHKILSYEVGEIKPNIGIFQSLCTQSGVHPSDIIMIGDSLVSDVYGALNAGIDAVHLERNFVGIIEKDSYIQIGNLSNLPSVL